MMKQGYLDFSGRQQRPQPRLLKEPVLIEGMTELTKTPYAHVNRFHWFARELEIRRGVTTGDTVESGLSFRTVSSEFLNEPTRRGYRDQAERFEPIADKFRRGEAISRRDFARMLTFKDVIQPADGAMAECLRHPGSLVRHFHAYWDSLKRLYSDEEWPESE
ncbi:Uncharacterised protein [uncultured archaeon]|nr:Uncharacterised protein [uncultured archaeon]